MSDANPMNRDDSGVRLQWDVRIALRDGVRLSAIAYLPERQVAPAPCVFILTPYVAQSFHERGVYFARRGFPFLAVDVRGRADSEGEFRLYADVADDSYDIVEWLAQQAYCNGKIAMWGGSYQGYVQWAAAGANPPHLATIVPVAAPFPGLDAPMRNNIFGPYTLQWLLMIAGRTLQDRIFDDLPFWGRQFKRWFESGAPFAEIDRMLGYPSPTFREWLAHPCLGDYWDRLNLTAAQYSQISLPVLTITGACDGDQLGALAHYREHLKHNPEATHYLVIGPWDHAGTRTPKRQFYGLQVGPASLVDLPDLHAQWYAWILQDGAKPAFLQDKVAYYVMGAEKWRYAETLAAVTSREQPLYLQSDGNPTDVFRSGSLTAAPPTASGPDCYIYDPGDTSLGELECAVGPRTRTDQRLMHASIGKQLFYHSATFDQDTEITGFFRLSVWLAIDQADTDFHVAIYEIAPDGTAIQLSHDIMRARYRESFREAKLIRTTAALRYDFERFMFVSKRLGAGARLRLVIGPINSIYSQKNHNGGGAVADESHRDAKVVTVRLFHDDSHPSVLHIPIGQPDPVEQS